MHRRNKRTRLLKAQVPHLWPGACDVLLRMQGLSLSLLKRKALLIGERQKRETKTSSKEEGNSTKTCSTKVCPAVAKSFWSKRNTRRSKQYLRPGRQVRHSVIRINKNTAADHPCKNQTMYHSWRGSVCFGGCNNWSPKTLQRSPTRQLSCLTLKLPCAFSCLWMFWTFFFPFSRKDPLFSSTVKVFPVPDVSSSRTSQSAGGLTANSNSSTLRYT